MAQDRSCQVGMGVMINMLTMGDAPQPDPLEKVKGKRIFGLTIDPEGNGGDGALIFVFDDGWRLEVTDRGRSCCEGRYITCDDNLEAFEGAILEEITTECVDPIIDSEWGDCHEIRMLLVHTNLGILTLATHNEHNGYYGGFWLSAEVLPPDEDWV